jgi:RNA polymerase sigma-70 factor (ECF subfamily)
MLSARRRVRDQPLDDRRAAAIPDMADGPEACLDKKDRSDTIRKCISQLSAVQRQAVDLVYFRDKTIEEVAYLVGAPVSTVKTRMFYARRRMEKLLGASGVGLH